MYEEYPKEIQEKIRELGLYGKTLKEIIIASVNACTEIIGDTEGKSQGTPSRFKKDVQMLQANQIKLMYKLEEIKNEK